MEDKAGLQGQTVQATMLLPVYGRAKGRAKGMAEMKMALDPRVKLLVLMLINAVIFASPDLQTEWLRMGMIAAVLALMGCWRQLMRGLLVYAGMMGALRLCGLAGNFFTAFVGMAIVCFRKIMPTVFFASGLMATTKVGDLVSAMQKLRMAAEYMDSLIQFASGPMLALSCALSAVGAVAGMLLGRAMLKKHFTKAGIA
jgi:energy-coupling factor transporter transmembrane protein EcfT